MILTVTGGCSGKQTGEDSSSPQTGSKKEESEVKITVSPQMIGNENASIELVWQPNPPHSLSDSNPKKLEYLTAKATEWAQAHPDVKIKIMDTTTAITESMAKTLVQASSGPVSYTHLDVYKRQIVQEPQIAMAASPVATSLIASFHLVP